MFVRFRQTKRKLQVSLCETRWTSMGPRQEHVAQLGSVPQPQTIAGRIDFHARLGPRLERLSNRVSPADRDKFLGTICARIPPCTADEVQAYEEARKSAEMLSNLPKDLLRHARLLAELPADLLPVISTEAVAASIRAERLATRKLVALRRWGQTGCLELIKEMSQEMRARGKSKSVL